MSTSLSTTASADVADLGGHICLDANVVVHAFGTRVAPRLAEAIAGWADAGSTFRVPSLWRYEITNALYRASGGGLIDASHLGARLNLIWALPLTYYDELVLHERAAAIALSLKSGAAYDAHYLALSEHLSIPLYTSDARLYNVAHHSFPLVELVPIA